MHNCPNCGSDHIQLIVEKIREQQVSLTGAVAGAIIGEILLGDIGGVIGGISGARSFSTPAEYMEMNYCLNCGNKWNAESLFKLVDLIARLTGIELDLSYELSRHCLADFISNIIPEIKHIEVAKNNRPLIIVAAVKEMNSKTTFFSGLGMLFMMTALFSFMLLKWLIGIALIIVTLICISINANLTKDTRKQKEEEAVVLANRRIDFCKSMLEKAINEFIVRYEKFLEPASC